jgi:hypothetical protein
MSLAAYLVKIDKELDILGFAESRGIYFYLRGYQTGQQNRSQKYFADAA